MLFVCGVISVLTFNCPEHGDKVATRLSFGIDDLERQLPRRPLDLARNVHAGAEAFRAKVPQPGRGDFPRGDAVPHADDFMPHRAAAVDEARAAACAARRVECLDIGHWPPSNSPTRRQTFKVQP